MVERPSCNTHVSLRCPVDESQLDAIRIRTTSRRSIALTFSSNSWWRHMVCARVRPLHGLADSAVRIPYDCWGSQSLLTRQPAATAIANVDNRADQLGDFIRVQDAEGFGGQ